MGRKSSLTPEQWAEVERRHLVDGVSINSLAAEFGVNESSIRRKLKAGNAQAPNGKNHLQQLAEEKVRTDAESKRITAQISGLPVTQQVIVSDLARKLTNISEHIGSAAEISAASAHRLSMLANQALEKVDEVNPLSTATELKTFEALQSMANGASQIPMNLLKANKDAIDEQNKRVTEQASPVNPARGTVFKIVRPA